MVTRGEPENAERSGRLKYPSSPLPFICVYSFRDYRKFLSDTVVGCSLDLDENTLPPVFAIVGTSLGYARRHTTLDCI